MHYESTVSLDIPLLRRYVLMLLGECSGGSANFLRAQVRLADDEDDLMMLRSAIFQCISMHLGEAEAMERIRSFDLTV